MSLDAMKQALEALEEMKAEFRALDLPYGSKAYTKANNSTHALRAAIEQAQRNEFNPDWDAMAVMVKEQQRIAKRIEELEAKPRQWQGLTDEERGITAAETWGSVLIAPQSYQAFARAIEAKLKEKNT